MQLTVCRVLTRVYVDDIGEIESLSLTMADAYSFQSPAMEYNQCCVSQHASRPCLEPYQQICVHHEVKAADVL